MNRDNLEERGYINKEKILEYVTEKEIYELVFGFQPEQYQYVTSPFRDDNNPGCWFSFDPNKNQLRFIDFGNYDNIQGIKMSNIDCFNAVQIYYKLPNFFQTLNFIKEKLIKGKNLSRKTISVENTFKEKTKKRKVLIEFTPKLYKPIDGRFWSPYGITKENLIEDKVFSVLSYKLYNTKNGDFFKRVNFPCYCFTDFKESRKKLYIPYKKGAKRFITNCIADDVGGYNSLPDFGKQLIITKSYKDWRVLKNQGINTVWFQNEGMIPSYEILIDLCRRFEKILVFFDNDEPGIKAGRKVVTHLNTLYKNKAFQIYLNPNLLKSHYISDPSDLYKKKSEKHLKMFLQKNNIIITNPV